MPFMTPRADRPHMPQYGISTEAEGQLPWSWAEERLTSSHNYWISTTQPDGRPHAMPVWAVWLDGALLFSTAEGSTKARNLARDPRCTATTEYAGEAVIVEGVAEIVTDSDFLAHFKAAYDPKYGWDMDVSTGTIYAVRPAVAFGFTETADTFTKTATRWWFD